VSDPSPAYTVPSGESNLKSAILIGAVLALVASNIYLYLQVDRLKGDLTKQREALSTEIANVRELASVTTESQRRHLDNLRNELDTTRQQAVQAASQAKSEALSRTDQVARRLAEEQQRQHQQVASELNQVKQVATTATSKLENVSTEVSNVKTEVASTKSELDKTIADLKRVTGDLGVTSGLVATNSKELAALKRLGERNYFEFNLGKTKQPQRVGDITLLLKKADAKRNRYTVEVFADDKKTEKKDKTINEPVQFYTSKARQPYEIVVNQVKKDQIIGYLATPKEQIAR
jgi:hypothetical protein